MFSTPRNPNSPTAGTRIRALSYLRALSPSKKLCLHHTAHHERLLRVFWRSLRHRYVAQSPPLIYAERTMLQPDNHSWSSKCNCMHMSVNCYPLEAISRLLLWCSVIISAGFARNVSLDCWLLFLLVKRCDHRLINVKASWKVLKTSLQCMLSEQRITVARHFVSISQVCLFPCNCSSSFSSSSSS